MAAAQPVAEQREPMRRSLVVQSRALLLLLALPVFS